MVHEARGDTRQAADCYRKVIEFIRQHPDDYDAAVLVGAGVTARDLSESVRRLHEGLQSLLSMRRIEARRRNARALWLRFS